MFPTLTRQPLRFGKSCRTWNERGIASTSPSAVRSRESGVMGCGISKKDSCVTGVLSDFPDIHKFDKIQ